MDNSLWNAPGNFIVTGPNKIVNFEWLIEQNENIHIAKKAEDLQPILKNQQKFVKMVGLVALEEDLADIVHDYERYLLLKSVWCHTQTYKIRLLSKVTNLSDIPPILRYNNVTELSSKIFENIFFV